MDIVDSEDSLIGVDSIDRLTVWTMKREVVSLYIVNIGQYGQCVFAVWKVWRVLMVRTVLIVEIW